MFYLKWLQPFQKKSNDNQTAFILLYVSNLQAVKQPNIIYGIASSFLIIIHAAIMN